MISNDALIPLLRDAGEGEIVLAGTLLKGLSAEQIAWVVMENYKDDQGTRITLHAYWHDIFIVSKIVWIHTGPSGNETLSWGASHV